MRIRCAHGACNDYDSCVQCFASGKCSGSHQPATHPFRVIEQNSFPIFDREWGADEELLLIEGAEIYGLGSWADIADHIGGYRTKDEVRNHYLQTYVYSANFPLPERCSPHDMELSVEISREEFQAKKKRRIEDRKEAQRSAPALQPKTKPTASVPACHDIQGYMPGRLEFETEYANEAEEAVQLMQFDPGDGVNPRTGELEPEMDLKLTVMEIYNDRLEQRVDRKKVILEHNLLDYRENSKLEKKRTKEEKDVVNRAKPFARTMNHDDFQSFCQGLVDEINLRQAISQLQEWRRVKIGDLRTGEKYEQEKAQRLQRSVPMGSMDRDRLASGQRSKQQPAPEPPSAASLLVAPDLPSALRRTAGTPTPINGNALNGLTAPGPSSSSTPGQSLLPPQSDGSIEVKIETGAANGHRLNGNGASPNPTAAATSTANGTHPPARQRYMPQPIAGVTPLVLNQENTPDLHLLTPEEAKLCEVVRLQPKPYLMIKEQILKEALKSNGSLKRKQAKEICRLEPQKGGRIFEFFLNAGWVAKA